jgi:hypothetical protein
VVSRVGPISVVVMSVSEVLAPSQTMHEKNGNAITKTKNVAIVAPQRSNSLDYLNFEEKRRLIASSLSLSDFLAAGNNTTKELKDAVVVGECCSTPGAADALGRPSGSFFCAFYQVRVSRRGALPFKQIGAGRCRM